jgi:hypothetical protein
MNCILNSFMVIIALAFFTVAGIFGLEIYEQHKAVEAGLQQCVVAIDSNTYEAVWQKDCK